MKESTHTWRIFYFFLKNGESCGTTRAFSVDHLGKASLGLKSWDNRSNVAESRDGEGDRLEEQVDVVVVPPVQKIVTPANEQEYRETELQQMDPVEMETGKHNFTPAAPPQKKEK